MRQTQLDEHLLDQMSSQDIISTLNQIMYLNILKPILWKELDRRRNQFIDSLSCGGE